MLKEHYGGLKRNSAVVLQDAAQKIAAEEGIRPKSSILSNDGQLSMEIMKRTMYKFLQRRLGKPEEALAPGTIFLPRASA